MTLTIGGFDHTEALQEGTLTIRQYGALRSSFRATLHFSAIPMHFPGAGQEILVKENGTTVWGGILVETEEICHSTKSFTIHLRGQGYEQILQRYCLPGFELAPQNPSDALNTVFTRFINPADGLKLGTREIGITKTREYRFYPSKASLIFDRLAAENGFVWWIDKTKTIHLRSRIPQTDQSLCIDLTGKKSNRLEDVQTLVYRSSTADYKNLQYVYNRTGDVQGNYIHTDRLLTMSRRYGSGEYGAAAESTVVTNQTDAQTVARQMIANSCGMGEIEFTTDNETFAIGQILKVTAPVCGIGSETKFCITEVRAVYFYDRFRYTVTARETDSGALAAASWEAVLADGSNN